MDRVYNIEEIMAAVDAASAENRRLHRQNEQLRGRLREARGEVRRLQHRLETSSYNAAYCRQLIVAAVGVAVALTCLLHSLVLAYGLR